MGRTCLKKEIVDSVLNIYNTGLTCEQIADRFGISSTSVQKIFKNAGFPKQYSPLQYKVVQLRKQGKCCLEIANELKIGNKEVRAIVNRIGMPFTEVEKARSIQLGAQKSILHQYGTTEDRIQNNIDYINEHHPDYEYVSGWVSSDNIMKLRCKKCGNEIKKSAITVRSRKNIQCQFCNERKKAIKQKEAEELKRQKQEQKEKEKEMKFWKRSFKQATLSFCPVCNSVFLGKNKYCSPQCARKVSNSKGKDKRIRKIQDRLIDNNITLDALFIRDKGKCWLCGEKCDFDDYSKDANGNFIVGKNYPSIDHVYPLSKGGMHSWNNVRLAHHYCNTIKGNRVVGL